MSGVSEKLAPGRRVVDLGDGVQARVRVAKIKRLREFEELWSEQGSDSNDFEAGCLMAQWGLVGCDGLLDEDGNEVQFATEEHPRLGIIAARSVVYCMTASQVVRLQQAIVDANVVTSATRKN
ncbi:MAG: hypothetical protein AB7Q17_15875 [Phycisphaerae bacterium]